MKKGSKGKRNKYLNYEVNSSGYIRSIFLNRNFGITKEDYDAFSLKQNDCCAICNKSRICLKQDLDVDHCHKTNKIRGLLCRECNHGVGLFKDDINKIQDSIEYLKQEDKNNSIIEDLRIKDIRVYYKARTTDQNRNAKFRMKYKISLNIRNEFCKLNNDCCWICNLSESHQFHSLAVDHNHCNNKIRGMLCTRCNLGLRKFNEDLNLLNSAITYLNKYTN